MKWVPCCENTSSGDSLSDGVGSHGQEFTGLPLCRGAGLGGCVGGGDVSDGLQKQLPNVVSKCPSLPRDWPTNRVYFKTVGLELQDFWARSSFSQ